MMAKCASFKSRKLRKVAEAFEARAGNAEHITAQPKYSDMYTFTYGEGIRSIGGVASSRCSDAQLISMHGMSPVVISS